MISRHKLTKDVISLLRKLSVSQKPMVIIPSRYTFRVYHNRDDSLRISCEVLISAKLFLLYISFDRHSWCMKSRFKYRTRSRVIIRHLQKIWHARGNSDSSPKKSMILALGLENLSQNYSPQVKLSRHVSATSQTFFVSVLYTSLSHPNLNWVLGRRGFVWRTSYASVPKTTTRDKFDPCYSPSLMEDIQ